MGFDKVWESYVENFQIQHLYELIYFTFKVAQNMCMLCGT